MFSATHLNPREIVSIIEYLQTLKDIGENTKEGLEALKKQAETQVEKQKEAEKQQEEQKKREEKQKRDQENEDRTQQQ